MKFDLILELPIVVVGSIHTFRTGLVNEGLTFAARSSDVILIRAIAWTDFGSKYTSFPVLVG